MEGLHSDARSKTPTKRPPSGIKTCASPNPTCGSYFARPSSAAKASSRSLMSGLRDLHLRNRTQHNAKSSEAVPAAGSRPNSARSSCSSGAQESTSPVAMAMARTRKPGSSTGVNIAFLREVQRHVSPSDSVAFLVKHVFNPASRATKSSFLSIPGLVHAQFTGEPTHIVAHSPDLTFHEICQALERHAELDSGSGRPVPKYWLPCLATIQHEDLPMDKDRMQCAKMAAESAEGALLLLHPSMSPLQLAWPMQDAFWAVKARGPEALHFLPCGSASSVAELLPALLPAPDNFDVGSCQFPGGTANQWQHKQELIKSLDGYGISQHAFNMWIRQALAVAAARSISAESSGLDVGAEADSAAVSSSSSGTATSKSQLFGLTQAQTAGVHAGAAAVPIPRNPVLHRRHQ